MRDCPTQVTVGQVRGLSILNNDYKEFKTTQWLDLVLQLRTTKTLNAMFSVVFITAATMHPDTYVWEKNKQGPTQQAHRQTWQKKSNSDKPSLCTVRFAV